MRQNILIIGATSSIAEAVALRYAKESAQFFLVARNKSKLDAVSANLTAHGARRVITFVMDANDSNLIPDMLDACWKTYEVIDVALIAHGTLPSQLRSETDMPYAIAEFRTNAESAITCMAGLAERFSPQGKGVIAVIGSVAGDRGRASNYLYGSAKAAIETYASGLRGRLSKTGVHLLTIKPGFVATAMTAELNLPALLTVSPEHVARDIQQAILKRKDVLYTPWFWAIIMRIIRLVPEVIFKRMRF
jgi:short-subunit dehydrogenase